MRKKVPNKVPMSAQTFVAKLKADNEGSQPIEIGDRYIYDKVNLAHLSLDVALIVTNCDFEEKVDLRYCDFKQAVKFCNCTFMREFDSGDDTDSRTIYRKNLVCNGSAFWGAARFRGVRCEGYALFRGAKFRLSEPLEDEVHGPNLQRPPVDFTGASFAGGIDCEGATFCGAVSFYLADCGVAYFREAKFFRRSPLKDRTKIDPESTREGGEEPKKILLERPPAGFTAAKFSSLDCEAALFLGAVSFRGVECAARASFQDARFMQQDLLRDKIGTLPDEIGGTAPIDFTGASFGYLNALGADFEGAASFNGLKCAGDAVFKNARFLRPKWEELKKHYENLKECEKDPERLLSSCPREYEKVRKKYERHRNDLNVALMLPLEPGKVEECDEDLEARDKALKKCEEDLERLLPSCRDEYRDVRKEYERHRNDLNIDFKYSEFRSGFFLQGARFARPVTLKRARISDTLNLNGARFGDTVSFHGTKMGRLRFKDPWFRSESVNLRECTFEALGGFHLACHPPRVDRLDRLSETLDSPGWRRALGAVRLGRLAEWPRWFKGTLETRRKVLAETLDSPRWRRVLAAVRLGRLAGWIEPAPHDAPHDGGADEVLNKIVDKTKFSMQPYLQLEKWYLLEGDENKAREIYRKGRRRARKNASWVYRPNHRAYVRADTPESGHDEWPWWHKLSDLTLDVLIGYGARIARLVPFALLFIFCGAIFFFEPHSTMNTVEGYSFPRNMPWGREFVEELSYSADLFVPVVRFGVDDRWTLDGGTPQTYAFVHMLVGWLVVPLLLAWLAGIIRRR